MLVCECHCAHNGPSHNKNAHYELHYTIIAHNNLQNAHNEIIPYNTLHNQVHILSVEWPMLPCLVQAKTAAQFAQRRAQPAQTLHTL